VGRRALALAARRIWDSASQAGNGAGYRGLRQTVFSDQNFEYCEKVATFSQ
jgi:hypothetical protein